MDQNLNIYLSGNYFLTLIDGCRKIYVSSQGYAVHLPNWTGFQGDLLVTETETFQKSTWVIFFLKVTQMQGIKVLQRALKVT